MWIHSTRVAWIVRQHVYLILKPKLKDHLCAVVCYLQESNLHRLIVTDKKILHAKVSADAISKMIFHDTQHLSGRQIIARVWLGVVLHAWITLLYSWNSSQNNSTHVVVIRISATGKMGMGSSRTIDAPSGKAHNFIAISTCWRQLWGGKEKSWKSRQNRIYVRGEGHAFPFRLDTMLSSSTPHQKRASNHKVYL